MIEGHILIRKLQLDKMQIFLMQLNKDIISNEFNLFSNLSLFGFRLKTIKYLYRRKVIRAISMMKESLMKIIYSLSKFYI